MKRKLNSVYALFAVLLIAYFQLSNSNNPNNGFTGAPPSGNTCSALQGGCHTGGTGTGLVSISGLPPMVTPNTTYGICVAVTRTNNVPQIAGFQLVVQQSNNANAGMLTNAGPFVSIQFAGGKYYAEQSSPQDYTNNVANFVFDWTSPATASGTITMYAAGNLANANGQNSGDAIEVATASTTLSSGGGGHIDVSVTGTNVSCFGGSNGSATATATGGGGAPYTFMWSNGGSGATVNNLTAGTYTVSVTNAAGGTGTGSVTITQPPILNVVIAAQTNITCLVPVGSATAQASGGVGSYTYSWSNGQSGPTATNLNAGTHTVSVTDGNGCLATTTVNITANITLPISEAGPPAAITCANTQVTLSGFGSSTGGNIQYLWTTVNGLIVSGATTLTPLVAEAGDYTLTVTNTTNGCTSSDMTSVTENTTTPTSNAGSDGLLTCTIQTLQLNGSSSSQGNNFIYLWTTADGHIVSGATTLMPVVDDAGTYCLKVTNTTNGCTTTDCTSVTENIAAPLANAGSAPSITCSTAQVTLNGAASSQGQNFSYLWTTTNGHIVSGATTLMPVVDVAAAYTLTVTNSTNGCTASSSVTVTSNTTPPTANAGPNRVLNCNNTSVVLDGSGSSQGPNYNYLWSGPGIQSGGNTPNPTVNAAGNYIILVTNTSNGCAKTDTATVTQTPTLGASISASQNVACNGANTGSATAAGSGGTAPYAYAWSNNASTAQITNLAAGTYTATLTDADNCTATTSIIITQPPVLNPNASATGETSVGAGDGMATANPTGGVPTYGYAWSNGANTQTITGLSAGNYSVVVTDANGCTASQTVTVASFSCSGFGANMTSTNLSCNGSSDGSATATITGGIGPFDYAWSNGGDTSSINNLQAGNYTVSITDGNGCEVTGNVSLTSPPALNLNLQQTNVACNGGNTGAATVNASGGTPGYTYTWSNGGTGASQNNLLAGNYTISVLDINGCLATIQANITEPPALAGTLTAAGESGVDANDGTVSASVSGGVAPYQYLWSNSATSSAITGLSPGNYCVSITDANNCVFASCAFVAQFGCTGLALNLEGENVGCAGGSDGSAEVDAAGFEAPLTYAWSNGSTGSSIGNLEAGVYTVSVTGVNGCASSGSIEITEPLALDVELLSQTDLECAGNSDGGLSVSGKGGTPNYTYSWSNGAISPALSGLGAGTYEVIVSDENNCTVAMSFEITVLPDNEVPTAEALDLTVSLSATGTASITPAMVDGGSSDNCSIATTSLDITDFDCNDLGANTVTLTVSDAAGNTASAQATVTVLDEISPEIVCPQNMTVDNGACSPQVDYPLPTATDNCGIPTVALTAGPASGESFPLGATTVTWAANDGNNNSASCSFTVMVISDFSVNAISTPPTCNGGTDGTATATPVGGSAPFTYAWNDPANQQTQTATGLSAGTYNVSVTDAGGCAAVQSLQVAQPTAIAITIDDVQDADGGPTGLISITASGGAGNYTYEWFLNGVLFSSEEDVSGLWDGEYIIVATDGAGCTQELTVVIELLNATEERTLENQVSLAPNPTSGRVYLNFEFGKELSVNFQVFDLSGKPANMAQETSISTGIIEIDLAGAASGVYLLRLIVNETVVVKRLVVGR